MSSLSQLEMSELTVLKIIAQHDGIYPLALGRKVRRSRYAVLPITEKLENLGLIVRRLVTSDGRTIYSFHMIEGLNLESIEGAIDEKLSDIAISAQATLMGNNSQKCLSTLDNQPTLSEILQHMIGRIVYLETRFSRLENYLLNIPKSNLDPSKLLEILHTGE